MVPDCVYPFRLGGVLAKEVLSSLRLRHSGSYRYILLREGTK